MLISNVCRAKLSKRVLSSLKIGMNKLTTEDLAPRQLKVIRQEVSFPAVVKAHRGQMISTISSEIAISLVDSGSATFCDQMALVYSIEDYIADPDVIGDFPELRKATEAKINGETMVLVAIIGDSRSSLAVCRNIVSGCQDMAKLIEDAKGALDASGCFIIED